MSTVWASTSGQHHHVSVQITRDLVRSANHSDAFLLRTNKSLCGPVGLRPLPADYQPTETTLPGVTAEESEQEVGSEDVEDAYQSAEQLGAELVTLSLLPESRWKSLLHLDVIKVSLEAPPTQALAKKRFQTQHVLSLSPMIQRFVVAEEK